MTRRLLVLFALGALLTPASAFAEPVQEFSFQLRDVKADGRYKLVFTSRSYDTTGGQPPLVDENYIRLPPGVKLRGAFLGKSYRCEVGQLRASLEDTPEDGMTFTERIKNLKATLGRVRSKLDAASLANFETCVRAQVGTGTAVIDARPYFKDPIPTNILLFLARGTEPKAVASFGIMAVPDETVPVVRDNKAISGNHSTFNTNIFDDPTPDGLYGYRMNLPSGPIAGLRLSISELSVTTAGLSAIKQKVTCTKRRRGRCVARKVTRTRVFWLTKPTCPASGAGLGFLAYYKFENGLTSTKTTTVPCPSFGS